METHIQSTGLIGKEVILPIIKIKYCLYARKSTESDEKQALSIDSQVKEMLNIAEREEVVLVMKSRGN